MPDPGLIARAGEFHPWDAMAPAVLAGLLHRGPFRSSAETGCGGSTIVLSQVSNSHTAFAINGEDRTIDELGKHSDLRRANVVFVEGESKDTLPVHLFKGELDLVLLDGPHAYPLPQVEFAYLFPWIKAGGWLVIDDLQIPSVHELHDFLKKESALALEEVLVRTAFYRRVGVSARGPDGWEKQGINRRTMLRYSWRDRLRKLTK